MNTTAATTTTTVEQAEARYDETSAALRAAAADKRDEALAEFEAAIENLRAVRLAAVNW